MVGRNSKMVAHQVRNGDAVEVLTKRFPSVEFYFHHCSVKWKEVHISVSCGHHEPFVTKWRNIKFEKVHPCSQCRTELKNFHTCLQKFENSLVLLTRGFGSENKVKVGCPLHGESTVNMRRLLEYEKSACKTCNRMLDDREVFLLSRFKHPQIDFSSFTYRGYFDKSPVRCIKHDKVITTSLNDIQRQMFLCRDCLTEFKRESVWGFGFRAVEKLCKQKGKDFASFYVLKCISNSEVFYKVGITTNSISERYTGKSTMPYEYQILLDIQLEPKLLCSLENHFKFGDKVTRYRPLVHFEGCKTECFLSKDCEIFNIVGDFLSGKL